MHHRLAVSVKHFGIIDSPKKIHISAWKQKCEARGGKLATINSKAEADLADENLRVAKKRVVLIGVFRSPQDPSKFVTLDGKVAPFT